MMIGELRPGTILYNDRIWLLVLAIEKHDPISAAYGHTISMVWLRSAGVDSGKFWYCDEVGPQWKRSINT